MDPLNKEDEEDDGTFFAKASDDETMRNLKWLFEKVVQPNFTLNQQINGGTLCSIILQKNQVELEPQPIAEQQQEYVPPVVEEEQPFEMAS